MATWELSTEWKKSSIERQYWTKGDKTIIREEGFRWATFTIESDSIPLTLEELRNEDGYELDWCEAADSSWEMVDMNDGCWSETEKGRNCTDEDLEAFEEAWDENYFEGVEELGWTQDDTEYYYTSGPLKLVNTDTGQEYSGSVDPTTVSHTITLPAELEEIGLTPPTQWPWGPVQASTKQTAKWPFETGYVKPEPKELELTGWFPVSINPAYVGMYEILTKESISCPHPNKGLWDGKKWNVLDHTVEEWRGLAKDPNA